MAHVDEKALQRACQALNGRISSQDWPGATREVIETYLDATQTSNAPDDVIERACVAYWGEHTFNRIFGEKSRKGIREAMRRAAGALSCEPGPVSRRNEIAGYSEFLNSDVPFVVRDVEGRFAILLDLEGRNYIGYRVYDGEQEKTAPADRDGAKWRDPSIFDDAEGRN